MAFIQERITKDGKVKYRVQVRLKGYRTQCATFNRKSDAKDWAQRTESALREGRHFKTTESRKRTLGQLIDKYLAERLSQRGEDKETVGPHLRWWKTQLGHHTLADVTPILIAEYRDKLMNQPMRKTGEKKERKLANATVIRYLASLSVCLSYGVQDLGWLESNPIKEVRKPKPEAGRVRYLSDDERNRLLLACQQNPNPYLYKVVVLALSTGARLSEIMNLTWKDIDFAAKVIRLQKTKNGERRTIALTGPALKLLQEMSTVRRIDSDYIFARKDGKKPMDIRKQWEKAVIVAKLKDFRFHDLRHTAASYLAMNHVDLLVIAEILGHKTLKMVKRYAHLSHEHTVSALEQMNRKQFNDLTI